jgi:hypothetical protein
VAEGRTGSAEERRYADASRALRHFLAFPRSDSPRIHAIGLVRHAARYNRAFGHITGQLDVTGFVLIVDDQHIAHATRQHGNARTEAKRGQLPIDLDDYARLPRILGDPDTVDPAETGRRGGPAAVVAKVIGGVAYRVIVELRRHRRQLAFVTIYKTRAE